MRLARYLLVLSFDAMSSEDFERAKEYPNFKRLLDGASYCDRVVSVSPSLTYPAHTSVVTGLLPIHHGITSNTMLQPTREKPDWYWYRKNIKAETVYELAMEKDMTVASILWPVTANADIQYNFPEIFPTRPWQTQAMVSLFSGSMYYQYLLNKKFGHIRKGIEQPQLDDFVTECLLYTLEEYEPDLSLVHFIDLDTMKHKFGTYSKQAYQAIERLDKRLGRILDYLEESGKADDSAIIVFGDHAHKPTHHVINLNRLFVDKGLIREENGRIKDYDVAVKSNDGSCYVYVINKDKNLEILDVLNEFMEEGVVRQLLNSPQIQAIGADPEADFMLDAEDGYYFNEGLEDQVITRVEKDENGVVGDYLLSSHGYLCDRENYTSAFIVKSDGIHENMKIDHMKVEDIAPIIAKILALNMGEIDGKFIDQIFIDLT